MGRGCHAPLWSISCLPAFATPGARADYPQSTIHLQVGEAPGGGTDFVARLVAQKLTEKIGQSVLVMNRPSADGTLAASYVAHAAPDGYNLLEISGNHTIQPVNYKPDFDPLASFTPITEIGVIPFSLVINTQYPINSLSDLIAYAKANPGKLNLGDSGPGSTGYWTSELLLKLADISIVHVSFSGGGPAQIAQLGNEIQLTLSPISTALAMVKAGKLRSLAITGVALSPLLPSVPTFAELGYKGFEEIGNTYGILAPARTPRDVVDKLHDDIVAIVKSADVQKIMDQRGVVTVAGTPEAFTTFMKDDIARWASLQAAAKAK